MFSKNSNPNPLSRFVLDQGLIVLDGGLATALEDRGYDLNDPLWSAKILLEAPDAIRDLHYDYLVAGADCISTATYQASFSGFQKRGLNEKQGVELMHLAVRLANEGRDAFWSDECNRMGRFFPLIAASIGPYGAYLADGSEYNGEYDISDSQLYDFHSERWNILAASEVDLLACETLPSGREAHVLLRLLRETPDRWAWLSFSCKDDKHLCDGTSFLEIVQACNAVQNVAAVGINCTAPDHVPLLLESVRETTTKPIIVYPNLGEHYDGITKTWGQGASAEGWLEATSKWRKLGARGIGGCCRIGPQMIKDVRKHLLG